MFSSDEEAFLDDLQQRGIRFFMDEADPVSGLMPDRAKANGGPANNVSSTASVGFGLTALCVGVERGWVPKQEAYDRSLRVLKFLRDKMPNHHGHFFHFIDMRTGERVWNSEVSNIDTALLMAGVLCVRQYYPDTELAKVADELWQRVDWPWLLDKNIGGLMCMGWKPEGGPVKTDAPGSEAQAEEGTFLTAHWGAYSEGPPLIHLLGIGSKSHPLPAESWGAWKREPVMTFAGLTFIQCPPLFTHQYPQCWFDLRGLRDEQANYFRNSRLATIAQRQWTIDVLSKRYETYGPNVWGVTASDGPDGYKAWGGPEPDGKYDRDINGVVVPCASAGSLAFEPRLCIDVLKNLKARYAEKGWRKYGFVDALNPRTGWYNEDVIGIDVGPTVLMAENARSGFVWKLFMSTPEAQAAVKAAGLRADGKAGMMQPNTALVGAAAPAGKR